MNRKNVIGAVLASSLVSTNASALDIALTNDDGWDAAGVQTLFAALKAAGHAVTLAGPSDNQSGASAGIDLGQANLLVTKKLEDGEIPPGGDQYSVALSAGGAAKPASAGQVAISIAEQYGASVDLLISGINAGANVGAFTNLSGTVGAAIHGISTVSGSSVPSVAISTDEPQPLRNCEPTDIETCKAANQAHFTVVAAWFVDFLGELEHKPGPLKKEEGLLPEGMALNINYPVSEQVAGVTSNVQGILPSLGAYPISLPIGCYANCVGLSVGESAPAGITGQEIISDVAEVKNADTTDFAAGYVTIVAIDVDLSAPSSDRAKLNKLVKNLND